MENSKGFTLIETMIAVSIGGMVAAGGITAATEVINKDRQEKTGNEFIEIINAIESRLLIDGYLESNWNKTSWNNSNEVVGDLFREQLIAPNANCSTGSWLPQDASNNEAKLMDCLFWEKIPFDMSLSAKIDKDSLSFVNKFEMILTFNSQEHFKENFTDLQRALFKAKTNDSSETSGNHSYTFIDLSNKQDITNSRCIALENNCGVSLSYNRAGSFEYLRADGGNSMLDSHLTFIDGGTGTPLTCSKWTNDADDNSGVWSQELVEECGIGIYEETGVASAVDVVADNGSFKSVVLDEECIAYEWNGSNVVDNGKRTPCGMVDDGTEIYQVIPTLNSQAIIAVSAKVDDIETDMISSDISSTGTLSVSDTANITTSNIQVANINSLVADVVVSKDLTVQNTLKAILIDSDTGFTQFDSAAIFTQDTDMQKLTATTIDTNILSVGLIEGKSLDSQGSPTANVNGNLSASKNLIAENGGLMTAGKAGVRSGIESSGITVYYSCRSDEKGMIRHDSNTGEPIFCNGSNWQLVSEGADDVPFGTIVMTLSSPVHTYEDTGWINLEGTSIGSSYITRMGCDRSKLSAEFGSHLPDLRGLFVRGASYQTMYTKYQNPNTMQVEYGNKNFGSNYYAGRKSTGYMQRMVGKVNTDDRSARWTEGLYDDRYNGNKGGAKGTDGSSRDLIQDNNRVVNTNTHETAPAHITAYYMMRCR